MLGCQVIYIPNFTIILQYSKSGEIIQEEDRIDFAKLKHETPSTKEHLYQNSWRSNTIWIWKKLGQKMVGKIMRCKWVVKWVITRRKPELDHFQSLIKKRCNQIFYMSFFFFVREADLSNRPNFLDMYPILSF